MTIPDLFNDNDSIQRYRARVAAKTVQDGECLLWNGFVDRDGYPRTKINKKTLSLHRIIALLEYGELPPGCSVMHSCDTPSCINPAHLSIGDNDKNVKDMIAKKRAFFQRNPEAAAVGAQSISTSTVLKAIREYLSSWDAEIVAADNGMSKGTLRSYVASVFGSSARDEVMSALNMSVKFSERIEAPSRGVFSLKKKEKQEALSKAIEMSESGMDAYSISSNLGVSAATVRGWLISSGVYLPRKRRVTDDIKADIKNDISSGEDLYVIAAKYGVSYSTAYSIKRSMDR